MRFDDALGIGHVVVGQHDGVANDRVRHTGGRRDGVGVLCVAQQRGAHLYADGDGVVGAVVAALRLGYLGSSGVGAGHPDAVQRCLGARVGESHEVDRRHAFAQQLGQAHLGIVTAPERDAFAGSVVNRRRDVGVDVAMGQRREVVNEVGSRDAVLVPYLSAAGVGEKKRVRRPEDGRASVAARHVAARFFPLGPRARGEGLVSFDLCLEGHRSPILGRTGGVGAALPQRNFKAECVCLSVEWSGTCR